MAALTKLTTNINLEMSGDTKRYLVSAKQGDKATRFIVAKLTVNRTQFRQVRERSSILQSRTGNMCTTHVHIPVRM